MLFDVHFSVYTDFFAYFSSLERKKAVSLYLVNFNFFPIMKKTFFAFLAFSTMLLASCTRDDDPRLIIITYDGLRWQELFEGADSALINNTSFVKDTAALKEAFWRKTPEERRMALMPFTWEYVAQNGYIIGNRHKGSQMQVANKKNFSYPGYSEMFCGYADDERIDSNDPVANPNSNVLQAALADPRYAGNVMLYGSWESIRYAVNNDSIGLPASVAYEPNVARKPNNVLRLIDEMQEGMPHYWGSERFDAFTYAYALETLKSDHPKVMWISFGDTDEWGHDNKYDEYLKSTHGTDAFIRRIVETCENDPFYRGRTTYLITVDHGRGVRRGFSDHGSGAKGSEQTWMMAFGKGVEALGETTNNGPFYTQQFAANVAEVLGIDFTPDNGVRQEPIRPDYKGEPLPELEEPMDRGHFPALKGVSSTHNGVRYTYYEGEVRKVDELDGLPVAGHGVLPNFQFDKAKKTERFGFQYKSLLKVEKAGRYLLRCLSNDGTKVWLDDKLVLDNDGVHGNSLVEAFATLDAGFHRIHVKYFQKTGDKDFSLTWEDSNFQRTTFPDSILFVE